MPSQPLLKLERSGIQPHGTRAAMENAHPSLSLIQKFRRRTARITTSGFFVAILLLIASCTDHTATHRLEQEIDGLSLEFWTALQERNYDLSRKVAERLQALGAERGSPSIESRGLSRLAYIEIYFGKWRNNWDTHLRRAETLSKNDPAAIADLCYFRGHLRGKWQREFKEGLEDLQETLVLASRLEDDHLLAMAHASSSELHIFLHETEAARRHGFRALAVAEHVGSRFLISHGLFRSMQAINHTDGLTQFALPYAKRLREISIESPMISSILDSQLPRPEQARRLKAKLTTLEKDDPSDFTEAETARISSLLSVVLAEDNQLEPALRYALRAREIVARRRNLADLPDLDLRIARLKLSLGDPAISAVSIVDAATKARVRAHEYGEIAKMLNKAGSPEKASEWLNAAYRKIQAERGDLIENEKRATKASWEIELKKRKASREFIKQQKSFSRDRLVLLGFGSLMVLITLGWRYRAKHRSLTTLRREIEHREAEQAKNAALRNQLERSQRLESVGTLAVGVAHDFNNSLTAILGLTELATNATEEAERQEHLEGILKATQAATGTTRSLMTFGPHHAAELETQDLVRVLRGCCSFVQRMMPRTLDLRTDFPDHPIWCLVDADKLQQVVLNLVLNASDADAVEIELTVENDPAAKTATVRVEDNGSGMTPEIANKVFDPFFTTKERGKGTGLGMSIVHGIVIEHGGSIDLDSAPGTGTRVEFVLPTAAAADPAKPTPPRADFDGRSLRILCAEDNRIVRLPLCSQLRATGFEVIECDDGGAVMQHLGADNLRFDLLLLDVDMPVKSGVVCLEEVRAMGLETPIILMSGLPIKDQHDAAFLQKPFTNSQLQELISSVLKAKT